MTTVTNVCAFLSMLLCTVPNSYTFGIWASVLCVVNFILAAFVWPCGLLLLARQTTPRTASTSLLLDRLYASVVAPFLLRRRRTRIVLVVGGCATVVAATYQIRFMKCTPLLDTQTALALLAMPDACLRRAADAAEIIKVWPDGHPLRAFREKQAQHQGRHRSVVLLWGVQSVDQSTRDIYNSSDVGLAEWDADFDLSDPEAQKAVLRGCDEPPRQHQLLGTLTTSAENVHSKDRCVLRALDSWASARYSLRLPLPPQVFLRALIGFLMEQPSWLADLSLARRNASTRGTGGNVLGKDLLGTLAFSPVSILTGAVSVPPIDLRVRHVLVKFAIAEHAVWPSYYELREKYDAWKAEAARLDALAPRTAQGVRITQTDCERSDFECAPWVGMTLSEETDRTMRIVMGVSIASAFAMTWAFTASPRAALVCAVTLASCASSFVGLLCVAHIDVDLIVQMILFLAGGLLVDPLAHFTHAFSAAPGDRDARARASLERMGGSVLASGLSTVGCLSPLLAASMHLMSQFALLMCALTLLMLAFAHLLLIPLLLLIGPTHPVRESATVAEEQVELAVQQNAVADAERAPICEPH